jgi:RNA polymerase sigma-70 factor (ECF subfamily)
VAFVPAMFLCALRIIVERQVLCYKALEVTEQESPESGQHNAPIDIADEGLVIRAREGEQWAAEALVRRYQQKAYAIAFSMYSDAEEARDLTQEAFLRAFRNLDKFRLESSFYTWFYRIIINTCLDKRRRLRRLERIFPTRSAVDDEEQVDILLEYADSAESNNPLAALKGKRLSKKIGDLLAALPERQRTAFQLKVLHGLSIKEISKIMETAEGTVKSHLFRATHFLQEALEEWV